MLFKFLISSFIFCSGLSLSGDGGWVSVERPEKIAPVEGADERDLSIWVVFSKRIGSEKILISFPAEPSYRYIGAVGDEMVVFSSSKGEEHRLQIVEMGEGSQDLQGGATDYIYEKDGYWYFERWVLSETHIYVLQTKSPDLHAVAHQTFVQSFHRDRI